MEIVYLDDNCVVVNKIPGESTEPLNQQNPVSGPGHSTGMSDLPRMLAEHLAVPEGDFFPEAVHRLDVPVSGCVLFARNPSALVFLNTRFRTGDVEKIYWGISEMPAPGRELPETGELVHWLKQVGNKTIAYDEAGPGRKKGVLHYRVRGQGTHYLFLEIRLLTGRHHQIRSQLARVGVPIKGDLKYGARRSEKGGGIRLHGYAIVFPNPAGSGKAAESQRIRVEALPPVQDSLWEAFQAFS
jgi:23S rRNA pseudouridine1911/1915/1917 synthase